MGQVSLQSFCNGKTGSIYVVEEKTGEMRGNGCVCVFFFLRKLGSRASNWKFDNLPGSGKLFYIFFHSSRD